MGSPSANAHGIYRMLEQIFRVHPPYKSQVANHLKEIVGGTLSPQLLTRPHMGDCCVLLGTQVGGRYPPALGPSLVL